jgi:hypothetical protein
MRAPQNFYILLNTPIIPVSTASVTGTTYIFGKPFRYEVLRYETAEVD